MGRSTVVFENGVLHPASPGKPRYSIPFCWENRATPSRYSILPLGKPRSSRLSWENRATPSRLPGKTALLHPASLGKPRYSIPPPWANRATPSRLPGKTALLHPASGKPCYSFPRLTYLRTPKAARNKGGHNTHTHTHTHTQFCFTAASCASAAISYCCWGSAN